LTEGASGSEPARPFLDFYAEHHVAPVNYRRDPAFIARRTWLLATLGIPPALLRGAEVLEFGPGTGDNASVLASFGPRRYVLVDGNPASLEALASRFSTPASDSGAGGHRSH
jgi:predicted RNA methylase